MSARHKSREYALQMLFQWEMGKQEPSRVEDGFWKNVRAQKSTQEFANQLFGFRFVKQPERIGAVQKILGDELAGDRVVKIIVRHEVTPLARFKINRHMLDGFRWRPAACPGVYGSAAMTL